MPNARLFHRENVKFSLTTLFPKLFFFFLFIFLVLREIAEGGFPYRPLTPYQFLAQCDGGAILSTYEKKNPSVITFLCVLLRKKEKKGNFGNQWQP